MAEQESDVIQSATGSYNRSSYEDEDWPSFTIPPWDSDAYPRGLLGPECLLVGKWAGSSYQHLHTQGAYDEWRARLEGKTRNL